MLEDLKYGSAIYYAADCNEINTHDQFATRRAQAKSNDTHDVGRNR